MEILCAFLDSVSSYIVADAELHEHTEVLVFQDIIIRQKYQKKGLDCTEPTPSWVLAATKLYDFAYLFMSLQRTTTEGCKCERRHMPLNLAYIKVVLPPPKSTCIDRFISWGDKTRATHSDIATMCVSKTSKYTHQDRGKIGKLGHGSQRGDVYRRLESEASKSAVESLVGNGRNGRTLTERRRGLRRGGGDGDLAPFPFPHHRRRKGRAPSEGRAYGPRLEGDAIDEGATQHILFSFLVCSTVIIVSSFCASVALAAAVDVGDGHFSTVTSPRTKNDSLCIANADAPFSLPVVTSTGIVNTYRTRTTTASPHTGMALLIVTSESDVATAVGVDIIGAKPPQLAGESNRLCTTKSPNNGLRMSEKDMVSAVLTSMITVMAKVAVPKIKRMRRDNRQG
ncbi:hypothetical protein OsI_30150 [Oryza sativa Indica Group]|uniref:Uncharacterized protein n=1 Tax=Oryza sativa subsp. indica TaxID=39946 RepID=A2YXT4_ORYSI|nr:hypothetical protein OsI_30150 [Oryza sativa Indica Group]